MSLRDFIKSVKKRLNEFQRKRDLGDSLGNEDTRDMVADLISRADYHMDSDDFHQTLRESDSLNEVKSKLDEKTE